MTGLEQTIFGPIPIRRWVGAMPWVVSAVGGWCPPCSVPPGLAVSGSPVVSWTHAPCGAPALCCPGEPGLWQACFSSMASPPKMPRWGPAWIMAFLGTEPATCPQQPWAPLVPEVPWPQGLGREQRAGFWGCIHPGSAWLCPGALSNGHLPSGSR